MRKSFFKRKPYEARKPPKRAKLRYRGISDTSVIKDAIQGLLRQIVIKRDGTCILRKLRHCTDEVLQADHLITRANSATYGDSRLVVCLCRSCHGGYKQWHKEEYDRLVKSILPKERVELWERCEIERSRFSTGQKYDWALIKVSLEQELAKIL